MKQARIADILKSRLRSVLSTEPVWRRSLRDGLQIHSTWVQIPEPAPFFIYSEYLLQDQQSLQLE